ncbi:hypothetical protein A2U01_0064356, partial [Trifolium medium]|nr:hypothetical protein [Trifolium medium]
SAHGTAKDWEDNFEHDELLDTVTRTEINNELENNENERGTLLAGIVLANDLTEYKVLKWTIEKDAIIMDHTKKTSSSLDDVIKDLEDKLPNAVMRAKPAVNRRFL